MWVETRRHLRIWRATRGSSGFRAGCGLKLWVETEKKKNIGVSVRKNRTRLVAIDLDGTLLNEEKKIDPEAVKHIEDFLNKGIRVVVATGRDPHSATSLTYPGLWQTPVVACNGSVLWDAKHQKLVKKWSIFPEAVRCCIEYFLEMEFATLLTEVKDDSSLAVRVASKEGEFGDIAYLYATGEKSVIGEARQEMEAKLGNTVTTTSSFHSSLEVGPVNVNKGSSLRALSSYLGILPEEVACIGDAENDIGMFSFAGTRVAMGNAIPQVKSLAHHISPPHTDHGASDALKWILSQSES